MSLPSLTHVLLNSFFPEFVDIFPEKVYIFPEIVDSFQDFFSIKLLSYEKNFVYLDEVLSLESKNKIIFILYFARLFVPLSQVFPNGCKQPVLRHESLGAGWGKSERVDKLWQTKEI